MKLKTIDFSYFTESVSESFTVTIHVSLSGDFYFDLDDLPKEMQSIGSKAFSGMEKKRGKRRADNTWPTNMCASKLEAIPRSIQEAITMFEESLVTRDELKVISYEFELEGMKIPERPDPDGEEGDTIRPEYFGDNSSWYRNHNGLSIKFEWEILRQVTNKSRLRKKDDEIIYLDGQGNTKHIGENSRLMSWTKEREEWFRGIENQMRSMMFGIEKFMNTDERMVEKLIEKGSTLLLLAKPVEEKR